MVNLQGAFSVSSDKIDDIIKNERKHQYYDIADRRAQVMATWNAAEYDEFITQTGNMFSDKSYIIQQSSIESNEEYKEKLDRMRLFPLEAKFLSAQQRIYDENNVNRMYPSDSNEFWRWKEQNFDDQGASITEFYRDKVLYVKETLGWGAVVTDIMMDDEGERITDGNGNVVPYNFIVRPHELWNFEIKQGQLTLLVIRQQANDYSTKKKAYDWFVYTPSRMRRYKEENGSKSEVKDVDNPFGEVPATLLRGSTDASSGFTVGKPRRYDLKGLYKAASELFYDLQKGSELFAHPIPAYPESIAKSLAGVTDDGDYDATDIKEAVGMVVMYPDDMEAPNNLFYQADMGGLQHLRDVIFKDLMSLIFLLAKVRDKSVQKSNVSGQAKAFDNVEEQGLLAQTAMDMQDIEHEVMARMAKVRDEDFHDDFNVNYSKHYDLSSANELWEDFIEGQQYGGVPYRVQRYQLLEYMRKRSAPQEVLDQVKDELDSIGLPIDPSNMQNMTGIVDDVLLKAKANPQMLSESAIEGLKEAKKDLQELEDNTEENDISIDTNEEPQ